MSSSVASCSHCAISKHLIRMKLWPRATRSCASWPPRRARRGDHPCWLNKYWSGSSLKQFHNALRCAFLLRLLRDRCAGRPLDDCRATTELLLGKCWATAGRLRGDCWATAGPLPGDCWTTAGRLLDDCWANAGWLLGDRWAIAGQLQGV